MKYTLLSLGLSIAAITEFSVTNNDTMFIKIYYKDGTLKERGIKVHRLKQGQWYHYDTNGFPYKIENYRNDRLLRTFEIGEVDERNNRWYIRAYIWL